MRHRKLTEEAFRQIQEGGPPEVGATIGSWADELAYRLVDIAGEVAVCDLPDGTVRCFSLAEIADVNKVQDRAIELQQLEHRRN